MKKLILMTCILALFLMPACYANTLEIAGIENISPFLFEENGQLSGLDYDIWSELAKRLDVQFKIQLLPANRMFSYLQSGAVDATLQLYYNAEREKDVIYAKTPIHWSVLALVVRKADLNAFQSHDINALTGKTVARMAGFSVSKEFDEAVKAGKFKLDEHSSAEVNAKKLAAGRVDCFICNYHVAMYTIKKAGLQDQIAPLSEPFSQKNGTFIALSKHGKNIADKEGFMKKIDEELAKMDADGTLDRFWEKYWK